MPDPEPTGAELTAKLKEVAGRSGKPLEVEVARSFLEWGTHAALTVTWKVFLGSYFQDQASEKVRELDVLARLAHINKERNLNTTLEAIVSCKGFLEEDYPITFSVSRGAVPEQEEPTLLHQLKPQPERPFLGPNAARMLLYLTKQFDDFNVMKTRRIQGFDIIRHDNQKNEWKSLGDRNLFEGLDSALRATIYWHPREIPVLFRLDEHLIRLLVPILVLSRAWHDFPIDDGKIGEPVETHLGFLSNLYPVTSKPPMPLFCLVVSRDRLKELQAVLLELFAWLLKGGETLVTQQLTS